MLRATAEVWQAMRWRAGGRERALASVGIATLALALYGNTAAGDFVFDDHAAIQVNPDVRWGCALMHKPRLQSLCSVCVGVSKILQLFYALVYLSFAPG